MSEFNDPDFNKEVLEGITTTDAMHDMVISNSRARVNKEIRDNTDVGYTQEVVNEMATQMLDSLLHDLGELGQPLLREKEWVSGFLAGLATCESLAFQQEPVASVCENGHEHTYIDLGSLIGYTNTAAYGIIEGHDLAVAVKELQEGAGQ